MISSLWSSDAIWRHRTWSTLTQVMACCLTAPSHYLNQSWLIISKAQSHSSGNHITKDTPYQSLKSVWKWRAKISFKSHRGQWVSDTETTGTNSVNINPIILFSQRWNLPICLQRATGLYPRLTGSLASPTISAFSSFPIVENIALDRIKVLTHWGRVTHIVVKPW